MDFEGTTPDAPELASTPAPQEITATPDEQEQPIDLDAIQSEGTEEEAAPEETEEPAEGAEDPESPEPELINFDVDGKQLQVPKELEPYLLRHADYTRKTQEVAEIRRDVEAKQAEAERNFSVSEEVLETRAALMNVNQELTRFQNVDWQKLEAEDPFTAQSAWRQFQQLKETQGQISGYLDQKQSEYSAQGEQATATRLKETAEFAQKQIPGWSPEMDTKITQFATESLGFTSDTLKSAYNPQVYQTLFYAWLGHQAVQKQQAAPKATTPPPQPLRKVSGNGDAPISKAPEDMGMEEYAAYRRQQMGRR
jgi:hypothetical protein